MRFKSITKVFCVTLSFLTLLFVLPINVFASNLMGDESAISFGETTFERISVDQIPEHITPLVFKNDAEKETYFANYFNNAQIIRPNNMIRDGIVEPMATNGDALVAYKTYGATQAKVSLYVNYTTSGDNNTGTITHYDPYTTFTGITFSMEWHETACDGYITSSGKDVYAYARGEVISYLVVNGVIEVARTPVSLNGYAYIIR